MTEEEPRKDPGWALPVFISIAVLLACRYVFGIDSALAYMAILVAVLVIVRAIGHYE